MVRLLAWAPDPVLAVDQRGHVVRVNSRAQDLFGAEVGSLEGRELSALLPALAGAPDTLHPRTDVEAIRDDGVTIPVDVSLSPIDADAGVIGVVVRDVTHRRRVQDELERSRRRLVEAEQLARIGSWEWDIAEGVVSWSDGLWRIYGLAKDSVELSYEHFLSRVHPDDRASVDERNHRCFADHQPFEDVKRVVRPDGSVFLMGTQGEMICDRDGQPLRMVGVCEDVTDKVRAREARARLASIIESSEDAVMAFDRDGRITSWNPGAERLYGWSASAILGRQTDVIVPPARRDDERRARQRILADERIDHYETQRQRIDGRIIDVSLALSPVRDGPQIIGGSSIARDISERKRFEQQLQHAAERDALTELFNRRRWAEELGMQVARSERYGATCAIVVIGLDGLKYVNDSRGHPAGDELLRSVARLLRKRVREGEVLGRLGGDEFAVLLPQADEQDAAQLGQEILQAVRHHSLLIDGTVLRTTASIGVAVSRNDHADSDELRAAGERAMYAAKDGGRDRVALASALRSSPATKSVDWEHRIRAALDNDAFLLACQPIVDLATGGCSRYELLLRMQGDDGQEIAPGEFLPVAERLGLIHEIDRWVMDRAITMLAEHRSAGRELSLAVNVSGGSVGDFELPRLIANRIAVTGVDPSRLILEVTETAAIANLDEARRFADALTALGCRFALDDFGVGFGSFLYLKYLPADFLKIDGDFIRSPRTRTDELVIESIVRVAGGLGKQTIAEWVGDEHTLGQLRAWGVDYAQGFHTGRPMPAADLAAHFDAAAAPPAVR